MIHKPWFVAFSKEKRLNQCQKCVVNISIAIENSRHFAPKLTKTRLYFVQSGISFMILSCVRSPPEGGSLLSDISPPFKNVYNQPEDPSDPKKWTFLVSKRAKTEDFLLMKWRFPPSFGLNSMATMTSRDKEHVSDEIQTILDPSAMSKCETVDQVKMS